MAMINRLIWIDDTIEETKLLNAGSLLRRVPGLAFVVQELVVVHLMAIVLLSTAAIATWPSD